MKYAAKKIIWTFATALVLTGCFNGASSYIPTVSTQTYDFIQGAFINGDNLYLIGNERDYEVPKAPFLAYKQLTESHLKNDIVCYRLSSMLYLTKSQNNLFEGKYRVLLNGNNVTAQDVKTYNLSPLIVDVTNNIEENAKWSKFVSQGCGLDKVKQGKFYVAEFSATGKSLYLSNRAEALEKSKLQNMLDMKIYIVRDASRPKNERKFSDSVEVAVKAPMYILGIIFAH